MQKKKYILQLIISVCGVFIILFGIKMFNQYLLMTFPLAIRMILMIAVQWLLFLVPAIFMLSQKEKLSDLGFTKVNITNQIIIGIQIAIAMSFILTIIPILLGLKDMVSSISYTKAWQFAYQFIYMIFGVALAEELVFRGYIFHKLLKIKSSRWFAITISSLLFGLLHIFNGNILQVLMATIIGIIYCICREKIKGCTIISLIIAHGVYDALIVLWVALL